VKPTVVTPVSGRPVTEDALVEWVNKEAVPLLSQTRTAVNSRSTERAEITTDGSGTSTVIWTSPAMPSDAAWLVSATVAGLSVSPGVQRAGFSLNITAQSTAAGAVTSVGTTAISTHVTTFGIDAVFSVMGRFVLLEVNDGATGAMQFTAVLDTTEARFT
jgi:hypothetical protein